MGLYASFNGRLTEEQLLIAAALFGGAGAQITGAAALRWHGVRYAPTTRKIQVLVPATTHRASRGFVMIIRTKRLDPRPCLRPAMEVCSLARATADAARYSRSLREVRALVSEVVQRGSVTIPEMLSELRDGPIAGSALLRRVLGELGAGVRSAPEAEFRALIGGSTILPVVEWNPKLVNADGERLPTPDGWIQAVGLALEVDSLEHHSSVEDWQRTIDRQTALGAHGILVLQFTPRQIRDDPRKVLATVERAFLERKRTYRDLGSVRVVDAGSGAR